MVKAISTSGIEKATGRAWPEWCARLDAAKGKDLPHSEIVKLAKASSPISGWWAQSVAVAYEQHIGRRKPGQNSGGIYVASVSRTFAAAPDKTFASWKAKVADQTKFGDRRQEGPATTSRTPKRLYWRCKFNDGSRAVIAFEAKPVGKSLVSLAHENLRTAAQIETAKTFWRGLFAELPLKPRRT